MSSSSIRGSGSTDGAGWWQNATAGAVAGFATVVSLHPLDVVRTRLQVNDGRQPLLPLYKNTVHAIYTIGQAEGFRGLYAGLSPAILGSTLSWGLYFFFYTRAKERYLKRKDQLGPGYHLVSSAEAGALVCLFTNPVWLIKTRMQLQTPLQQTRPYTGFSDAVRTILKEEGWHSLYRGIGPSLLLVSHGALQFMFYEEARKFLINVKSDKQSHPSKHEDLLTVANYATLGAFSKLAAMMLTYPYQVLRSRLMQRPGYDGSLKYSNSIHVIKETVRFEGICGFYRGITPSLVKNLPAASITFVVYEKVLALLRLMHGPE